MIPDTRVIMRSSNIAKIIRNLSMLAMLCLGILILAGCAKEAGRDGEKNSTVAATVTESSVSETVADTPETGTPEYRVITLDADGAPVAGVRVQFCTDTLCVMGETDADGVAAFDQEKGAGYTVHIYSVPEGYMKDETEYSVPETYGDVGIVLKMAE